MAYETFISGISVGYQISENTNAELKFGYHRTYERFDGDSIDVDTKEEFPNGQARFSTDQFNTLLRIRHKFNNRLQLYTGGSAQIIGF